MTSMVGVLTMLVAVTMADSARWAPSFSERDGGLLPSTPDKPYAPDHAFEMAMPELNTTFRVRAYLNDKLFAPGYKETYSDPSGSVRAVPPHQMANAPHRHCHYVGVVDGEDQHGALAGYLAFSTCGGAIEGRLVTRSHDLVLGPLHPDDPGLRSRRRRLLEAVPHVATPVSEVRSSAGGKCGVSDEDIHDALHHDHLHDHAHDHHRDHDHHDDAHGGQHERARRELAMQGVSKKYVEALVASDVSRIASFQNDLAATASNAVSVMNNVASMYRTDVWAGNTVIANLEVVVVLIGQHFFTSTDPWESTVISTANGATVDNGDVDVSSLLDKFNTWASGSKNAGDIPQNDNHILLSGRDFDGNTIGLAGMNAMCSSARSGNVNMGVKTSNVVDVASTVAHEMGHNFGMGHDGGSDGISDNCDGSSHIMAAIATGITLDTWSTCSATYLGNFMDAVYGASVGMCLENAPTLVYGDPVCGNGVCAPHA